MNQESETNGKLKRFDVVLGFWRAGLTCVPVGENKQPIVGWKEYQHTRPDAHTMQQWVRDFRNAPGWALLTGSSNDGQGVVVIDADAKIPGAIEWINNNVPASPMMVKTKSGGVHKYFRHPGGKIKNGTRVGSAKMVDIRGDGGIAVLPLSTFPGGSYEVISGEWSNIDTTTLPVFDPSWFPGLNDAPEPAGDVSIGGDADHDELVAYDELPPIGERKRRARAYLEKCPGAQQGNGADSHAFHLACKLVGHFALPAEDAADVLGEWGERDDQLDGHGTYYPWKHSEINHKVRDAIKAVMREPERIGEAYNPHRVNDAELDDAFEGFEAVTVTSAPETTISGIVNLGGALPVPEAGPVPPVTIADVAAAVGSSDAPTPAPKKNNRRVPIMDRDLDAQPDPEPLIDGFIDMGTLTSIYGPSNCGKSFLALDLACSVARGVPFLNHFKVYEKQAVCYIYAEGKQGLKKRVQGWRIKRKLGPSDNLCFLPYVYTINDDTHEELNEVLKTATDALGRAPQVLILDTLAKNMQGDENSTKDMSDLVRRLSELVTEQGITVIVVHHTGKDESKGARGSTALKGGLDNELEVLPHAENLIRINSPKIRDEVKGWSVLASTAVIKTGVNRHGKDITTLVLNYSNMGAESDPEMAKPLTPAAIERSIAQVLTDKPASVSAIAKAVALNRTKVGRILKDMQAMNRVNCHEVTTGNNVMAFEYWAVPGVADAL